MTKPLSPVAARRPPEVHAWLRQSPPLAELRTAYPAEWEAVERELAELVSRGPDGLAACLAELSAPLPAFRGPAKPSRAQEAALVSAQVRRVMTVEALKKLFLSGATGVTRGRVRFNLLNGFVAQQLLFEHDLERKPVSLLWFRLLWPLLWQRRLLLPLVQPKGIYCFYSRRLIRELAALIGDRPCLEIAAGDGTLSRFLGDAGVDVVATDDHSWSRNIRYPETVLKLDARTALRKHRPRAVVCSWPPPGNDFERHVFDTPSVELYVALNTGADFGSGSRADYERQTGFERADDRALARLVLPPELDAAVHVFRRIA